MYRICFSILLLIAVTPGYGQRTITGRIIDSQTKKPIAATTVFVLGTENETKTNVLGYFQLIIETNDTHLVIGNNEYGFQSSAIPANDSFTILITKDSFSEEIKSKSLIVISDSTMIDFLQIQDESLLTPDAVGITKDFCDLKAHYIYKYQILANKEHPSQKYKYTINYNPKEDKVSNLEVSVQSNSENEDSNRNIKSISTIKYSKQHSAVEVLFPPLKKGQIISIKYEIMGDINNIRPVQLNDSIPKHNAYFSIHIPEYLEYTSNYDSITPPVRITYPRTSLTSYYYSYRAYTKTWSIGNSYSYFTSKKLIWEFTKIPSSPSSKNIELNFKITDIKLLPNNDFGLRPKVILKDWKKN